MAGIIKGGMGYGYMPLQAEQPVMKTIYGNKLAGQTRNDEKPEEAEAESAEAGEAVSEIEARQEESGDYIREEDAKIERRLLIEEYEQLRLKYEKQSEEYVLRAKEKAAEIYEKTKEIANKTVSEAKAEGQRLKEKAREEGAEQGYDEGYRKGYDEGYVNALKKCRDTLVDLKTLAEEVGGYKSELYLNYERQLFDVIFEIAQKITVDSLKQKDKAVISKMLKEAGKRFRGSKNVKITLSKLDISEEAELDEELLSEIFKGGTNIEIELLKDAPSGTLIIDNGTEITDAGVQTQLKMIEQLGMGKYRDKTPAEMLRAKRTAKSDSGVQTKKKTADRKNDDDSVKIYGKEENPDSGKDGE